MRANLSQWWNALAASVSAGRHGLGAYLGEEGLTLVQVSRSLSGIQVGRWATLPFTRGRWKKWAPSLKKPCWPGPWKHAR